MKIFTARYQGNHELSDELSSMNNAMKLARKSSGYSQVQFSKLIGIFREALVHIEGMVEYSLLSLECEVLRRWFTACAPRINKEDKDNLQRAINKYVFSSLTRFKNQQQKVA